MKARIVWKQSAAIKKGETALQLPDEGRDEGVKEEVGVAMLLRSCWKSFSSFSSKARHEGERGEREELSPEISCPGAWLSPLPSSTPSPTCTTASRTT